MEILRELLRAQAQTLYLFFVELIGLKHNHSYVTDVFGDKHKLIKEQVKMYPTKNAMIFISF